MTRKFEKLCWARWKQTEGPFSWVVREIEEREEEKHREMLRSLIKAKHGGERKGHALKGAWPDRE